MHAYLGIDLGTSSVKAVALDDSGEMIAWATAGYATHTPRPGWAEQEPAAWLRAARRALSDLARRLPPGTEPRALAVTGQMPTLALLGRDGKALRPAIVWYDGRAEAEATNFLRAIDIQEWYRRTGIVLDAHYIGPMYAWVAGHEPDVLAQEHHICSAKDALLHALTGAWITDPSTASGYGIFSPVDGVWDTQLCGVAGVPVDRLPAPAESWSVAGWLGAKWAETGLPAGLPVVTGAADALTGVVGSGAARPRTMAMINGTSTSLVVSSDTASLDAHRRSLLTPHALPGLWGLEMDLMSTGSALRWLATIFGAGRRTAATEGDMFARAARSSPGANGLIAVPYLAGGEQGALWDPHAPAAFVGLTLAHSPDDLARALLEGILFETRRCLEAWEEAGAGIDEVVICGGFDGRRLAPLAAVALDRPIRTSHANAGSASGAALLAGLGVSAWDAERLLALARRQLGEQDLPDREGAARYQALYARYTRVSAMIRQHIGPIIST